MKRRLALAALLAVAACESDKPPPPARAVPSYSSCLPLPLPPQPADTLDGVLAKWGELERLYRDCRARLLTNLMVQWPPSHR